MKRILSTVLVTLFLAAALFGGLTARAVAALTKTQVIHSFIPSTRFDIYHIDDTEKQLQAQNKAKGILGASKLLETPVAVFHTSLANAITSSATSMTLVSGLTADGTTLASSTYSFVLDSGQSNQEFVVADCTNTICTNMQRGISVVTGTTTIAGSAQSHRRTATVDIVDAPILLKVASIVSGVSGFPNIIRYATEPNFATAPGTAIPDLTYMASLIGGGITPPFPVSIGGTGAVTFPVGGWLFGNGTGSISASSSPTVGWITSTSTATSTFAGPLVLATTTISRLGIGTSTPYAPASIVGFGGVVAENFTATSSAATSTLPNVVVTNNASTTNLWVSNFVRLPTNSTSVITAVVSTSTTFTTTTGGGSATALCVAPKVVSGGGFSGATPGGSGGGSAPCTVVSSGPSGTNGWNVQYNSGGGTACPVQTVTVYAMCVNP